MCIRFRRRANNRIFQNHILAQISEYKWWKITDLQDVVIKNIIYLFIGTNIEYKLN